MSKNVMVFDLLLDDFSQLRSLLSLDLLLAQKSLVRLLKHYLLACKVEGKSPATIRIYADTVRFFILFAHESGFPSNVSKLDASHVRLFLLHKQEAGCKPATVNAYYRGLKTFFNWLVTEGYTKESPMDKIKPPRIPKQVIKPFSQQDLDNLLLLCSGDGFLDLRNRAIILLFLDTGMRLAELAGLDLKDLNFGQETIRVRGKGAKERVVRMGKVTQKALLAYLMARDDDHKCLWVTEERAPMTRYGIQGVVKRLCKRAGITDAVCGPHTFRHTSAIHFLRNGGGEFALQILLGHSTLAMTRKYVSSLGVGDMIKAHRTASPVDNMKLKS